MNNQVGFQKYLSLLLLLLLLPIAAVTAETVLFEDFDSLNGWDELTFDKIETFTEYSLIEEAGNPILKIDSNSSASGIIYDGEFSVYDFPKVEWRWKAENIVKNGNAKMKSGDDYPVRIYVIFPYDPDEVGFFEKIAYEAAKAIYGEYPPLASLNYIWANREHREWSIPNPFTDRAIMIPVEKGTEHLGEWRTYSINLIDDYKRAFGKEPPAKAGIAIMGDTDNTGENTVAYLDYIKVSD